MVIGINYNTDGTRYIAMVFYDINAANQKTVYYKELWSNSYDELYIIDSFCPTHHALIEEIVLKGCRIS